MQTRIPIKSYQNTTRDKVVARSRFFSFFIFCNFHKKQEMLVDNKLENIKIKITKNGRKTDKKRKKESKWLKSTTF